MGTEKRKLAVVIGGGNGIGAACCRLMAERGWALAVVDLDLANAQAVAGSLGGTAFALDVSDYDQVTGLSREIESALGPVDALVVSSGTFQVKGPAEKLELETWRRIFAVNLDGTYFANRTFGTAMAAQGRGSIVNIGSIAGLSGNPLHAYGPSKAAIINMTKSLAGEWGRSGVRVNCVSPGLTLVPRILERQRTGGRYAGNPGDFTALGRGAEPSEVAEGIEFLASDRASAITGTNLVIDCGWEASCGWQMYGGVRQD
ncbi:SDR family NAD(P)-dependent oxidoreductase [Oceanibacterium hippocampi]|uniref:Cyclopentanol dehydrogenase n=1 Tax=Oceanibacterium hippocampi TaxID=745714 RepID=A0A1Y5SIZ3_9PROT|nr:SDR family oxidoreductase [Oceanibacterium hippocampi]SLN41567.1 Cyclopentanol dehydrogenase [Oceanibacterium hippocampi]